jgi:hypothetical protein
MEPVEMKLGVIDTVHTEMVAQLSCAGTVAILVDRERIEGNWTRCTAAFGRAVAIGDVALTWKSPPGAPLLRGICYDGYPSRRRALGPHSRWML